MNTIVAAWVHRNWTGTEGSDIRQWWESDKVLALKWLGSLLISVQKVFLFFI